MDSLSWSWDAFKILAVLIVHSPWRLVHHTAFITVKPGFERSIGHSSPARLRTGPADRPRDVHLTRGSVPTAATPVRDRSTSAKVERGGAFPGPADWDSAESSGILDLRSPLPGWF